MVNTKKQCTMKAIILATHSILNWIKNFTIYGLISTSPIGSIKTTNLIRPESSLKFRVVHNKYMDHIVLQLEDIRKTGKIETKDAEVTNFSILSTKPKRRVGSKGKMSDHIVDEIRIVGL